MKKKSYYKLLDQFSTDRSPTGSVSEIEMRGYQDKFSSFECLDVLRKRLFFIRRSLMGRKILLKTVYVEKIQQKLISLKHVRDTRAFAHAQFS